MSDRVSNPNRSNTLWILFAIQLVCAVFFFGDAYFDVFGAAGNLGYLTNDHAEFFVSAGLIFSLGFTASELYRNARAHARLTKTVETAQGALADVIEKSFQDWGLSESERDVALLTIKGMSVSEVANMRDTKEGTVKAQCTSIYRKAGVANRSQLISLFIEDLLGDSLLGRDEN